MLLCAIFVLTRLRMVQVQVETCSVSVMVIKGIKIKLMLGYTE